MVLLSGFLEVLLRALVFIGLSLALGGAAFYYAVLRPAVRDSGEGGGLLRRAASLVAAGAFIAALSQLGALPVELWSLAGEGGRLPLAPFLATGFARAGLINSGLALCLGFYALRLRRRPGSGMAWAGAALVAAVYAASGAWLTHGASRLVHSAPLMALTVLHQLGAAAWIGGAMHLAGAWRLLQGSPDKKDLWPRIIARFSPLAMGSVALILAAGISLSFVYIGDLGGLVGTAYGVMVITKAALMGFALLLGGMNFLAVRAFGHGDGDGMYGRVPASVEAEAGIGAALLMAAAALTSQPVAADTIAGRALPAEVLHTLAPKMPQMAPAPFKEMLAGASSSVDQFALPTSLQMVQSNFNHNISGIFVIILGLGALLYRATGARGLRHWPLLFLPFVLFLFIIVEPTVWPLGNEGFWETLASPEVLQHRMGALLVIGLGLFEWRVSGGGLAETRWRYAFPLLCFAGGALLLTHSHSVFATKWAFLIEVSHNAIGLLAVLIGAGRWLELRLSGRPEGRAAGLVWPVFFILVGLVLLFYREA